MDDWATRRLGDMGGTTGRQCWATTRTTHSTFYYWNATLLSYDLGLRGHNLRYSHIKLIYLAKHGHFALKGVGIKMENSQNGCIVRV